MVIWIDNLKKTWLQGITAKFSLRLGAVRFAIAYLRLHMNTLHIKHIAEHVVVQYSSPALVFNTIGMLFRYQGVYRLYRPINCPSAKI